MQPYADPTIAESRAHADRAGTIMRAIGLALFAAWIARYMTVGENLLHGSLLVFHEAGHALFMPFGEFMMVLGGSLFQLLVPAFFVAYFLHRGDRFAAAFAALYLAASLVDVSRYIADARAGELPLLGGERSNHDWTFLLIELEMLNSDIRIGGVARGVGWMIYWLALGTGTWLLATPARLAPTTAESAASTARPVITPPTAAGPGGAAEAPHGRRPSR